MIMVIILKTSNLNSTVLCIGLYCTYHYTLHSIIHALLNYTLQSGSMSRLLIAHLHIWLVRSQECSISTDTLWQRSRQELCGSYDSWYQKSLNKHHSLMICLFDDSSYIGEKSRESHACRTAESDPCGTRISCDLPTTMLYKKRD